MLDSREDQVEENDNVEDKGISESKLDTSSETDIADDEAEQKQPQKISDEAGDKVSDKVRLLHQYQKRIMPKWG